MTPETRGDVGSPNRILREEIGGKVIVRTGPAASRASCRSAACTHPISVVRMAVGDAYGAEEWREGEGDDEVAFRTERIERSVCRAVAEFAFREAERTGREGLRRPEVHRLPDLRGNAQGGDGRVGRRGIPASRTSRS